MKALVAADKRMPAIDALRAFAALAVLLTHTALSQGTGVGVFDGFMAFFAAHGGHGLDLFFVLSGFCIHWAYVGSTAFDVRRYLSRRWRRIYPPYFFALVFAILIHLVSALVKFLKGAEVPLDDLGFFQISTHLFLIHNFFESTISRINGPFWTIALEAQFYLLYILFRRDLSSSAGWLRAFMVAAVLCWLAWEWKGQGDLQPLQPFKYWIQWLMGAYAAHLYNRFRARSDAGEARTGALFFPGAAMLLWATTFFPSESFGETLCFGLGFSLLLLAFLRVSGEIWKRPFLNLFPALGTFSYSLYLIHHPIVGRLRTHWISDLPAGILQVGASFLAVAAALLAAYTFFIYFEKPYLQRQPTPKA